MSNSISEQDSLFYLPFESEHRGHLFACGVEHVFEHDIADESSWGGLHDFRSRYSDWMFGWISYDAKSSIEQIERHTNQFQAPPEILWVVPKHLMEIRGEKIIIHKGNPEIHWKKWQTMQSESWSPIECTADVSEEEYLQDVRAIQHHIQRGDIYEVNYCMRFSAHAPGLSPPTLFKRLSMLVKAPMMGYVSWKGTHVICGSPERFLAKQGDFISAHPIKGTARRSSDPAADVQIAKALRASKKERAENTMIVDLMRNDLSRFAKRGSVRVPEWCEVHTFPTVHHLISKITCEVDQSTAWVDMLRYTFPMGSMTGAPKVSAMNIIQRYERQPRAIYSGTLGYLTPDGDFDMNVIIRSVIYQELSGQLTIGVGGAITDLSDPEAEYQECQLKVAAIMKALW